MKKKLAEFLNISNFIIFVGTLYLILFVLLSFKYNKSYKLLEFLIDGFAGFFKSHYIFEDYLIFTAEFLPYISLLSIGLFFVIVGYLVGKKKKIPKLSSIFFIIFLIFLFSFKIYEKISFGLDYVMLLFLILSIFVLFFVIMIKVEHSQISKKTIFSNFALSFLILFTLIASLYRYVNSTFISLRYNKEEMEKIKGNMLESEILRVADCPNIKLFLYLSKKEDSFFIPIVNSKFLKEYLNLGLYASHFIKSDAFYECEKSYDQFRELNIPTKAKQGMNEEDILKQFGNPTRTVWMYLERRNLDEVKYKTLFLKNKTLQSIYTLVHSSTGIIKFIPRE